MALETLIAYEPRYAAVAERAGVAFEPGEAQVIERLSGNASTEFGIPGALAAADEAGLDEDDLGRLTALITAAWDAFDTAAHAAVGVELAKGPRGGGRDLDKIIGHVRDAEVAYLAKLGSRAPAASAEDPERPMALLRQTFVDALAARAYGTPLADPARTRSLWPPRYALRRAAWHSLDHAWEIEDRAS